MSTGRRPQAREVARENTAVGLAAQSPELEAEIHRGWTLYGRQDLEGALGAFERCKALGPDSVDAHYGLGIVLKAMDRKDESARAFDTAAELARMDESGSTRMQMLRRMAVAHASFVRTGEWSIEGEGQIQ
jgi:tetratricopeptide (TPR) repeat protein